MANLALSYPKYVVDVYDVVRGCTVLCRLHRVVSWILNPFLLFLRLTFPEVKHETQKFH